MYIKHAVKNPNLTTLNTSFFIIIILVVLKREKGITCTLYYFFKLTFAYIQEKIRNGLDTVQVSQLLNIYETKNSQMLATIYNYVIYTGNKKTDNDKNLRWMDEAVKQRNLVEVDWALGNFNISNEPSLYQLGNNKLSNLKAKTLIIWGDKDVTVPKIMFDETVRLLPEATVLVYENAGHSIVVDETEKLAIDIVHFIS